MEAICYLNLPGGHGEKDKVIEQRNTHLLGTLLQFLNSQEEHVISKNRRGSYELSKTTEMRKYNGFFVYLEILLREWGMTGGMV